MEWPLGGTAMHAIKESRERIKIMERILENHL
jgi:hypothetical protein